MDDETLAKCEKLLDLLYAHMDQRKLQALIGDIEALRDRLLGLEQKKEPPNGAAAPQSWRLFN